MSWVRGFGWFLLVTLPIGGVQAEVYTWIDQGGRTHYADEPPANVNMPVRRLDRSAGAVSTIGGSALRESEHRLLRDIDTAAAARRQARLAAARLRPQPAPVTVVRIDQTNNRPPHWYYSSGRFHRRHHAAGGRLFFDWRNAPGERFQFGVTGHFGDHRRPRPPLLDLSRQPEAAKPTPKIRRVGMTAPRSRRPL